MCQQAPHWLAGPTSQASCPGCPWMATGPIWHSTGMGKPCLCSGAQLPIRETQQRLPLSAMLRLHQVHLDVLQSPRWVTFLSCKDALCKHLCVGCDHPPVWSCFKETMACVLAAWHSGSWSAAGKAPVQHLHEATSNETFHCKFACSAVLFICQT